MKGPDNDSEKKTTGKKKSAKKRARTTTGSGAQYSEPLAANDAEPNPWEEPIPEPETQADTAGHEEEIIDPVNPMAVYFDHEFHGEADTRWEKFRRFSHTHKRKIYGLFFVALFGTFITTMFNHNRPTIDNVAWSIYDNFEKKGPDWVYSIDGHFFGAYHLKEQYDALARYTWGDRGAVKMQSSNDLYASYLQDQFETDSLVLAALNENALDSPEAKIILSNALRHAIAEYYVYTKLRSEVGDFTIRTTEKEVEENYQKNKAFYDKSHLSKEEVLNIIRKTLLSAKKEEQQIAIQQRKMKIISGLQKRMQLEIRSADKPDR